jgi:hypothetical protein
VVHDEAYGGMAAGERDQLAGAGDVDEPQAGQVQVDVTGAICRQRGERGAQHVLDGQVCFAGEHQAGTAMERADGENAPGACPRWQGTVAHDQTLFNLSTNVP